MHSHDRLTRHLALHEAALDLSRRARDARAQLAADSDERLFFLGVDAAALEVLQPELEEGHTDEWLELREPSFREGVLCARAALAAATVTQPTPSRVYVPEHTGDRARQMAAMSSAGGAAA